MASSLTRASRNIHQEEYLGLHCLQHWKTGYFGERERALCDRISYVVATALTLYHCRTPSSAG